MGYADEMQIQLPRAMLTLLISRWLLTVNMTVELQIMSILWENWFPPENLTFEFCSIIEKFEE